MNSTLIKILSLCGVSIIALNGAYWYGRYVSHQQCKEMQYKAKYDGLLQDNLQLKHQIDISNNVISSYNQQIDSINESYTAFIGELQHTNSHLVKQLNSTNKVNAILINNIKHSLNPAISIRYINNESSIYYMPSSLVEATAQYGKQCVSNTLQLNSLIDFINGVKQ